MLWRDGNRMTYEYVGHYYGDSDAIELTVYCDMEGMEKEIGDSIVDHVMNYFSISLSSTNNQLREIAHMQQSFLLDLIEYLIESAIDKQLAYENNPTGQYIAYVADPVGGLIIKPRAHVKDSEVDDILFLHWEDFGVQYQVDMRQLVFNALSRYGHGIEKYRVTVHA
jgi:hypothetical protein